MLLCASQICGSRQSCSCRLQCAVRFGFRLLQQGAGTGWQGHALGELAAHFGFGVPAIREFRMLAANTSTIVGNAPGLANGKPMALHLKTVGIILAPDEATKPSRDESFQRTTRALFLGMFVAASTDKASKGHLPQRHPCQAQQEIGDVPPSEFCRQSHYQLLNGS